MAGQVTVLESVHDNNYEASQDEVEEYAAWLGMDLPEDNELLWIAREGLSARLPEPWKPCQTEDHELFYFNFETGESTWDHPADARYRKMYNDIKRGEESCCPESTGGAPPEEAEETVADTANDDDNHEASKDEVEEYAAWLGMNLPEDSELLWIAREGLNAPLPEHWEECQTENDELFYFNFDTGESTWDHPCDAGYRKMYNDKKREEEERKANKSRQDQKRESRGSRRGGSTRQEQEERERRGRRLDLDMPN